MKSEPKISTLDIIENLLFELKASKESSYHAPGTEVEERLEALLSHYMEEREEETAKVKQRNAHI